MFPYELLRRPFDMLGFFFGNRELMYIISVLVDIIQGVKYSRENQEIKGECFYFVLYVTVPNFIFPVIDINIHHIWLSVMVKLRIQVYVVVCEFSPRLYHVMIITRKTRITFPQYLHRHQPAS